MTIWLVSLTPTGREPRRPVAHAYDKGYFVSRCYRDPEDRDRRQWREGDRRCIICSRGPR